MPERAPHPGARASDACASAATLDHAVHQVINPLNAIAMNADLASLLLARERPHDLPVPLRAIADECMRCARIVRDIHAWVRPLDPSFAALDLAPLLQRALEGCPGPADAMDVSMADAMITGDAASLVTALRCLLTNAFEHGARRIAVHAERTAHGTDIEIADDGSGIPADLRTQVFQPFFSSDSGNHTGLGLNVATRIMQAHGGTLVLIDSSAQGTRMRLHVPCDPGRP